jgi:seryl-tRNA synthetase
VNAVISNINALVDELPNANTTVQNSQSKAESLINDVARNKNKIKLTVNKIDEELRTKRREIEEFKKVTDELTKTVEDETVLAEIRNEQAKTLANRYDADNYHSSWMGLMRPMREESRVGIIVASFSFIILGILCIWFAFSIGILKFGLPGLDSPWLTKLSNIITVKDIGLFALFGL